MTAPLPRFSLRFDSTQIVALAARYSYNKGDTLVDQLVPRVRSAGYLTKDDLVELGAWKSPRTRSKLQKNSDGFAREATRIALSTDFEELRIGVLTLLHGVGWPIASMILHLMHHDPYPALDFRALWSVGAEVPKAYTFDFWWSYTQYCREIAEQEDVSMRRLDRALWQYSKENQV